jgi:RES domain-containing protein
MADEVGEPPEAAEAADTGEPPRVHVQGTWWRVTRADSDPLVWTTEPADGRWQRGSVVRALYLGDSEATVWAEWYRHTSELGVPPGQRLPRAIWRIDVDIDDVADLTAPGVLAGEGIARLDPARRQWPRTQPIGEALWRAGALGVLAPSAARRGGKVLAIFRTGEAIAGVTAVPPATRFDLLPAIPPGLRT